MIDMIPWLMSVQIPYPLFVGIVLFELVVFYDGFAKGFLLITFLVLAFTMPIFGLIISDSIFGMILFTLFGLGIFLIISHIVTSGKRHS